MLNFNFDLLIMTVLKRFLTFQSLRSHEFWNTIELPIDTFVTKNLFVESNLGTQKQ